MRGLRKDLFVLYRGSSVVTCTFWGGFLLIMVIVRDISGIPWAPSIQMSVNSSYFGLFGAPGFGIDYASRVALLFLVFLLVYVIKFMLCVRAVGNKVLWIRACLVYIGFTEDLFCVLLESARA